MHPAAAKHTVSALAGRDREASAGTCGGGPSTDTFTYHELAVHQCSRPSAPHERHSGHFPEVCEYQNSTANSSGDECDIRTSLDPVQDQLLIKAGDSSDVTLSMHDVDTSTQTNERDEHDKYRGLKQDQHPSRNDKVSAREKGFNPFGPMRRGRANAEAFHSVHESQISLQMLDNGDSKFSACDIYTSQPHTHAQSQNQFSPNSKSQNNSQISHDEKLNNVDSAYHFPSVTISQNSTTDEHDSHFPCELESHTSDEDDRFDPAQVRPPPLGAAERAEATQRPPPVGAVDRDVTLGQLLYYGGGGGGCACGFCHGADAEAEDEQDQQLQGLRTRGDGRTGDGSDLVAQWVGKRQAGDGEQQDAREPARLDLRRAA